MTTTPNLPCTAALLMGGRSRRMGSEKASLRINGEPLWKHQVRTLCETGAAEVVISANSGQTTLIEGYPVVVDEISDEGPLRAISTLLRQTDQPGVLVLGVDLPGMTSMFLRNLAEVGVTRETAVVPVFAGRFQPLSAYYPFRLLPIIDAHLSRGDRALQGVIRQAESEGLATLLSLGEEQRRLFVNLNTPADLTDFLQAGER